MGSPHGARPQDGTSSGSPSPMRAFPGGPHHHIHVRPTIKLDSQYRGRFDGRRHVRWVVATCACRDHRRFGNQAFLGIGTSVFPAVAGFPNQHDSRHTSPAGHDRVAALVGYFTARCVRPAGARTIGTSGGERPARVRRPTMIQSDLEIRRALPFTAAKGVSGRVYRALFSMVAIGLVLVRPVANARDAIGHSFDNQHTGCVDVSIAYWRRNGNRR